MPVEIREIIIRTDISGADRTRSGAAKERELNLLRRQLIDECKRIITKSTKKAGQKR
jgi:hypothetical protein